MPKSISIQLNGDLIIFHSDFEYRQLNASIPGAKWDKNIPPAHGRVRPGAWVYPAAPDIAARITEVFAPVLATDQTAAVDRRFTELAVAGMTAGKPELKSKTKSWTHQEMAFYRAYNHAGYMLGLDMGAGKTKVAVDLCVNRGDKYILIVAPKSVILDSVWPKNFALHGYVNYSFLSLDGGTVASRTERASKFLTAARGSGRPAAIVINYESVWRAPFCDFALKAGFDCVICDESHNIKSHSGKASKFLAKLAKTTKHRLALTGTPMSKWFDIFSQYKFLDSKIFGENFSQFVAKYGSGVDQYFKPVNNVNQSVRDELNALIYSRMSRVKTRDVLQLPPVQHITHSFDLSPRGRQVYDDLKKKMEAELNAAGDMLTVSTVATGLLRLAQITGGFAPTDDGKVEDVDAGKRGLLYEVLEGLDDAEPVVIFCRFRRDLEAVAEVAKKLDRGSLELSGRVNQLAEWKAGVAPIIAIQIRSGGAGVDCTRACHVVYYSKDYSPIFYEQSLRRADRPGQTRPVRFYHLMANNTVDYDIQRALESGRDLVEEILDQRRHKLAS